VSLVNGGVGRHLGFHHLDAEEMGGRTDARRREWVGRPRPTDLGPLKLGSVPLFPHGFSHQYDLLHFTYGL
jgi:hypothetical protein